MQNGNVNNNGVIICTTTDNETFIRYVEHPFTVDGIDISGTRHTVTQSKTYPDESSVLRVSNKYSNVTGLDASVDSFMASLKKKSEYDFPIS